MYDRILIPTDGSAGAMAAAEAGVDLADRYGASIHTLYVADIQDVSDRSIANLEEASESRMDEEGAAAVEDVRSMARDRDVEATAATKRGDPARNIMGYVDRHDIDVIVMGTHGRSGVKRVVLGSVAETVIRQADIPVLVVPLRE